MKENNFNFVETIYLKVVRSLGGITSDIIKNIPKILQVLCLIIAIKVLSGCFAFQPITSKDKLNKKELKKLPESEIIFVAKYQGTQTGTQLYFREDSIFTLQTQTAFGWEQYNGNYMRVDTTGMFSLTYFNDHKAIWHYVDIKGDKELLKVDLSDSTMKRIKTFQVLTNVMSK